MPRLRALASLALAMAVVACSFAPNATPPPASLPSATIPASPTTQPTPPSTVAATPTPIATTDPTPTVLATPSAEPTTTTTPRTDPTPNASNVFKLELRQLPGSHGLGDVLQIYGIAEQDVGLVAYGNIGQTEFDADYVVWFSPDGIDWMAINPVADNKDVRLYDMVGVVATSNGFVALGSAHNAATNVSSELVFKSVDGQHWIQQPTMPPEVGICGFMWFRDQFLGRACDASMWMSTDAESWQQLDVPVLRGSCGGVWRVEDELWASTQERQGTTCGGPINFWNSSDGVEWHRSGEPLVDGDDWFPSGSARDGQTFAFVTRPQSVGYRPNERHAWYLRDGIWHPATNPPRGTEGVLSTSGGFVAYGSCSWVGQDPDYDGYDDKNVLWTSPDGKSWSYVAPSEPGWWFDEAFVSGGKLILIGSDNQRYMADKHAGSVWVADLPPDGERWANTGDEVPPDMCQNP